MPLQLSTAVDIDCEKVLQHKPTPICKMEKMLRGTLISFSNEAKEYAIKNISQRIILIDGQELGKLMVRYGIGVQPKNSYQVVDIDEDFFDE